jgi:hypothetical protein
MDEAISARAEPRDKVWDLDARARAALDPGNGSWLADDAVPGQAREGFQFLFDRCGSRSDRGALARDTPWIGCRVQHPPWLDLFRTLTGEPAIRLVDGQATRYLPGHFLTGMMTMSRARTAWPPMSSTSPALARGMGQAADVP